MYALEFSGKKVILLCKIVGFVRELPPLKLSGRPYLLLHMHLLGNEINIFRTLLCADA